LAKQDEGAGRQIAFINAAHFLTHYCLLILPTAVLVMARPGGEFGSDYGPVLALATAMFVLYGVISLPQGWLAERLGRRTMMLIFCFGTGLSLIATGFATTPLLLAATLGATGLFAAIYHPIGTAMLVEAAGTRPGRQIGINGVFGNIGVASAPFVTAFLAGQYGWRIAFFAPGIFGILLGLAWLRVPEYDAARDLSARPFPTIPRFLVRRAVIVLLLVAAVSGLVFNAYTILLPKLMQERLASDGRLLPLVGILAFAVTLCGAVTQFTVGRLIDRKTLKRVFVPLALVLAPTLAALAFADGWITLPLAGAAAAVIFGQVTVNETMTARYIAPPLRAKLYSIRFFVGFLGSAAAAPLVAILHERTGSLTSATLVLAGFAVVTLLCALFFPDRREELQPELWAKSVPVPAE
jgi:MFS family permease